jgi:hypothetical protein
MAYKYSKKVAIKIFIPIVPVGIAAFVVYIFREGSFIDIFEPVIIYSILWALIYLTEDIEVVPNWSLGIIEGLSMMLYIGYIVANYNDKYEFAKIPIQWFGWSLFVGEVVSTFIIEYAVIRRGKREETKRYN